MSILGYILIFTFLGSIASLIGGFILLAKKKLAQKISHYLSAFAAGVLLSTAFFELLPEASSNLTGAIEINIFLWTLLGILIFFLLERFVHWFHHPHQHKGVKAEPVIPLIILGDSIHNLIDGVVIAASFLVSIPLGVTTALAVAAHEVPQEIGDFGVLLSKGVKVTKVVVFNLFSAATALIGGVLTFLLGEQIQGTLPAVLSLTAGFFIYIASSDLIPEIHGEDRKAVAFWETVLLFAGVVIVWMIAVVLA